MNMKVKQAGERVIAHLEQLERVFPPDKFKLTFVARYVGNEGLDADVIVSADDHDKVMAVMERHKGTKGERP